MHCDSTSDCILTIANTGTLKNHTHTLPWTTAPRNSPRHLTSASARIKQLSLVTALLVMMLVLQLLSQLLNAIAGLSTDSFYSNHSTITHTKHIHIMTYLESSEDIIISRERALKELRNHGGDSELNELFLEEMGYSDTYRAEDVLIWLGY